MFACLSLTTAFVTTTVVFLYVYIAKDNGRLVAISMIPSLITGTQYESKHLCRRRRAGVGFQCCNFFE